MGGAGGRSVDAREEGMEQEAATCSWQLGCSAAACCIASSSSVSCTMDFMVNDRAGTSSDVLVPTMQRLHRCR